MPPSEFTQHSTSRLALALAIDREPIGYAGPTRGKVHTPELRGIVARALTGPLTAYFDGVGAAVVVSLK